MGLILRQSTAVDFLAGPFIDDTDGKTPETALTITSAEVRLSKNGGNMAAKNEATALAHDELGMYVCKLDATDTNTLGTLQVTIWESGALIVYHEFMIVTANEYDSKCSTDYKQVDVIQVGGVAEDIATETKQDIIDGIVDTILVDTNELQTDWVNGGRLDLLIDAVKAKTDIIGASVALEAGGNLASVLADTNELQTDWTNGGRLDLLIDAIKAITDTLTLAAIADVVLDEVVDANAPANANSLRETVNVIASALAGKLSGGGTASRIFRDLGDTKNRLSVTVDANYNRTASTPDGT